jgi:uncharacterized protein (DUF1015 family)
MLTVKTKGEPVIHFHTDSGEEHALWAISNAGMLEQIQRTLAHRPLYIADGHHRYESALAYRRERRRNQAKPSGSDVFDFVMMTLVDFADPGLVILPPHRLVRGLPLPKMEEMVNKINSLFKIEELSLNSPDVWQKVAVFFNEEAGQGRIVLCRASEKNMLLLEPHNLASIAKFMPGSCSEHYKKLTVSILDHIILEGLLGLRGEQEAEMLTYSYDQFDAADMVLSGEYQLAFLIGPVKEEAIKMIADVADRMPRKSTYFYPKLPSGLVFYRMSER